MPDKETSPKGPQENSRSLRKAVPWPRLLPCSPGPSAGRGKNIHNAGLNVEVVWDGWSRVDEQTNQDYAVMVMNGSRRLSTCAILDSATTMKQGQRAKLHWRKFRKRRESGAVLNRLKRIEDDKIETNSR
ncbi:hypothetical protein WN51_09704 [Melipona quadrifasciata]|uniref:Uncharacterized protein n=1 Tax=Melipona quadrifasciata TaxID=166423 RepID=A0A0N0U6N6_9HYME|nr:hypothetical protein WN51_09704 [Melipona quadrifasciata]